MALVVGLSLWVGTAWVGDRREPWDSAAYWSIAYPLAILLSAAIAYHFPQRAWRWALTVMLAQMPVMVFAGSGLGLLPIGMVVVTVLALPAIAAAQFAAGIAGARQAR